jgi:hypothetical protein
LHRSTLVSLEGPFVTLELLISATTPICKIKNSQSTSIPSTQWGALQISWSIMQIYDYNSTQINAIYRYLPSSNPFTQSLHQVYKPGQKIFIYNTKKLTNFKINMSILNTRHDYQYLNIFHRACTRFSVQVLRMLLHVLWFSSLILWQRSFRWHLGFTGLYVPWEDWGVKQKFKVSISRFLIWHFF